MKELEKKKIESNKKPTKKRKRRRRANAQKIQAAQKQTTRNQNRLKEKRRAENRARRRKKVMMQRILIAAASLLIVFGIGGAVFLNLSSFKLTRKLSAGDKYAANGDYEKAQSSYEDALQIDPTTVKAYHCLAQNHLAQDDSNAAKEILYTGWETTQDESLLDDYCTVVFNDAVTELNEENCTFDTVKQGIHILSESPENHQAIELLHACYSRLFTGKEENSTSEVFMDAEPASDTCLYEEYEQALRLLLTIYEQSHVDAVREVLAEYAVLDVEYVYLSVPHLASYQKLLEDINAAISDPSVEDLAACLSRAIEVEADFADMFVEFEQGRYESAREFIVSDMYQQIQDSFIAGESGYWEGTASIPVNREQMVIHKTENGFTFSWLNYDDYENSQGVITVWGSRHLDDGVQRTTISYEPAAEDGSYYPHIEYIIAYEYSNVLKNGTSVQMNYRFTKQVTTQEGMEKSAVGDWGGEHEWEIDYST